MGLVQKLGDAQRMKAIVKISPEQGIATLLVEVQPGTAGDQDGEILVAGIKDTLEQVFPIPVLVDLVINDQFGPAFKNAAENGLPVVATVPVEISRTSVTR